MLLEKERNEVVRHLRLMAERGLTKGTGGNISCYNRAQGLIAISPSAVEYCSMTPKDVAVIGLDGEQIDGNYEPSSEKALHLFCYKKRADVNAVVHTHSVYSMVLACLHENLPNVHYLMGYAGGMVECIPYHLFGSTELAAEAADGLGNKNAVLLGNHGLLAVGNTIEAAFQVAEIVEFISEIYYKARCIGNPKLLSDKEMKDVIEKFKCYGRAKVANLKAANAFVN